MMTSTFKKSSLRVLIVLGLLALGVVAMFNDLGDLEETLEEPFATPQRAEPAPPPKNEVRHAKL